MQGFCHVENSASGEFQPVDAGGAFPSTRRCVCSPFGVLGWDVVTQWSCCRLQATSSIIQPFLVLHTQLSSMQMEKAPWSLQGPLGCLVQSSWCPHPTARCQLGAGARDWVVCGVAGGSGWVVRAGSGPTLGAFPPAAPPSPQCSPPKATGAGLRSRRGPERDAKVTDAMTLIYHVRGNEY